MSGETIFFEKSNIFALVVFCLLAPLNTAAQTPV